MNLDKLSLTHNEGLANMAFLEDMPELTRLGMYFEDASSISGSLANCTKLQFGFFNETGLGDLSWSFHCSALKELHINGCGKMSYLRLDDNQLTNLDGCEMLIRLSILSAADNQLEDVKGLVNSSSIKTLNLENNQITGDPDWMKNYTELETLNISRNQISGLTGMENNAKLDILVADQNQITRL